MFCSTLHTSLHAVVSFISVIFCKSQPQLGLDSCENEIQAHWVLPAFNPMSITSLPCLHLSITSLCLPAICLRPNLSHASASPMPPKSFMSPCPQRARLAVSLHRPCCCRLSCVSMFSRIPPPHVPMSRPHMSHTNKRTCSMCHLKSARLRGWASHLSQPTQNNHLGLSSDLLPARLPTLHAASKCT